MSKAMKAVENMGEKKAGKFFALSCKIPGNLLESFGFVVAKVGHYLDPDDMREFMALAVDYNIERRKLDQEN